MPESPLLICRCEDVSLAQVEAAIAAGARDLRALKIRTRAGAGLCQGCICDPLLGECLRRLAGVRESEVVPSYRPPVRPVPLSSLSSLSNGGAEDTSR